MYSESERREWLIVIVCKTLPHQALFNVGGFHSISSQLAGIVRFRLDWFVAFTVLLNSTSGRDASHMCLISFEPKTHVYHYYDVGLSKTVKATNQSSLKRTIPANWGLRLWNPPTYCYHNIFIIVEISHSYISNKKMLNPQHFNINYTTNLR